MATETKRELCRVNAKGRITLPVWAVEILIRRSGVRSKKRRILKKVLKREFCKTLRQQFNLEQK